MPSTAKINGTVHSWQTIEPSIAGLNFENLVELNYKSSLDPGVRRNRAGKVSGYTHGEENHEADFTLPKEDSAELLGVLGDGFGLVEFEITVSYSDGEGPVITDTLSVRISELDAQNAQGSDQSVVKKALKCREIYWGTLDGRQVRISNLGGSGPAG